MANIKSAKKRISVIEKKTALNRVRKSQIKTAIKRFDDAVVAGNKEEAQAKFQTAQKKIYQVASKGTIHKNAADRKVSKLANRLFLCVKRLKILRMFLVICYLFHRYIDRIHTRTMVTICPFFHAN